MTGKQKVLAGIGAAVVAAGVWIASKSSPTIVAPGYWRPGANGLWYPCGVAHPYLVYNQPMTGEANQGKATVQRFDYQAFLVTTDPLRLDKVMGAINHNPAYMTIDGRPIPIAHQPSIHDYGYFPAPTTQMGNPGSVTVYYSQLNPGAPIIPPSETVYAAKIASLAEWIDGNIPAFQAAKLAQCSAPQPTKTLTPTVVPSATPFVPPVCPTCAPPQKVTVVVTATPSPHFGPAPSPFKADHNIMLGPFPTKVAWLDGPKEYYGDTATDVHRKYLHIGRGIAAYECEDGKEWVVLADDPSPCGNMAASRQGPAARAR